MTTRTQRSLVALAVAVVLLAGCATGPTIDGPGPVTEVPADPEPSRDAEPDAGPAIEVCSLLAGVDPSALVKVPTDAGTDTGTACVIEPLDASSTGSMRVQFLSSGGIAHYEQQKSLLGVSSEVPGFGDEAFTTGTWLLARSGEEFLSVQVVPDIFAPGERLTEERVVEAARVVAANAGW